MLIEGVGRGRVLVEGVEKGVEKGVDGGWSRVLVEGVGGGC